VLKCAARIGIVLNEHYEGDGEIIFKHACRLGFEGIVSKRLGSPYRSGRPAYWVKVRTLAKELGDLRPDVILGQSAL
jgi:ATP-dependent DNA ligase